MAEELDYTALAESLTRDADKEGGYDWSTSGARGATTVPYLYSGTYYRLRRGLSAAGRKKFDADLKKEKTVAANKESGQWPETEKKLIRSYAAPDPADKSLYQVQNQNPD